MASKKYSIATCIVYVVYKLHENEYNKGNDQPPTQTPSPSNTSDNNNYYYCKNIRGENMISYISPLCIIIFAITDCCFRN